MGRRILNDALRSIVNAERRGKATVELKPISTVISSFLNIMKYRVVATATFESIASCCVFDFFVNCILKGYIKNFEVHDPHRVGRITVDLQGRVNDCRALTYRQDIKAKDIEKYKTLKLPTRQWGYVVISTPDGVLDHEEAIRRNVGGQVLGYFH
ncbi:hypothetical protein Golax_007015 [Gossypium laxum]|uniref:Ribosomal protein S8 n=1 Tax=Gossypium laxum TaxID=34288 RepID=A0A7J9A5I0_9ROSI|nr:hypothetical protein [Gossypium laxum]